MPLLCLELMHIKHLITLQKFPLLPSSSLTQISLIHNCLVILQMSLYMVSRHTSHTKDLVVYVKSPNNCAAQYNKFIGHQYIRLGFQHQHTCEVWLTNDHIMGPILKKEESISTFYLKDKFPQITCPIDVKCYSMNVKMTLE